MSICPDKIVISEGFDGELPNLWKEKLDAHISECSECEKHYEKYAKLSKILNKDSEEKVSSFDYSASFEKLKKRLDSMPKPVQNTRSEKELDTTNYKFWQRSINLPVPIVAAAVLALVFLPAFMFFASTSARSMQHAPSFAYPVVKERSQYSNVPTVSGMNKVSLNSNINGFLRLYMPNQESQGIIISLPAGSFTLDNYGDYFQNYQVIETNLTGK